MNSFGVSLSANHDHIALKPIKVVPATELKSHVSSNLGAVRIEGSRYGLCEAGVKDDASFNLCALALHIMERSRDLAQYPNQGLTILSTVLGIPGLFFEMDCHLNYVNNFITLTRIKKGINDIFFNGHSHGDYVNQYFTEAFFCLLNKVCLSQYIPTASYEIV